MIIRSDAVQVNKHEKNTYSIGRYQKGGVTTEMIGRKGLKQKVWTLNIIKKTTTPVLASGNGTSH